MEKMERKTWRKLLTLLISILLDVVDLLEGEDLEGIGGAEARDV